MPFSMRLLHAELPQYGGHHSVSLARLHAMIRTIDQVTKCRSVFIVLVVIGRPFRLFSN